MVDRNLYFVLYFISLLYLIIVDHDRSSITQHLYSLDQSRLILQVELYNVLLFTCFSSYKS